MKDFLPTWATKYLPVGVVCFVAGIATTLFVTGYEVRNVDVLGVTFAVPDKTACSELGS